MNPKTISYIIKRLILAVFTVWVVFTLTFFIMHAVPGGPFVGEKAISKAAQQALEEDVRYSYNVVTLQLVCSNDQWQVVPDKALLSAISGGTVG